ncbi:MAG: hypothetical protein JWM19_841 [Actinomycetia bacterium]|nr:hypothetical protein [Actinomycetes bacterium]
MSPDDSAKSHWWHAPGTRRVLRAVIAAVPVCLVNATAFIGQFMFLHAHLSWIVPGQVLFAVTLESVAVYLAWHAHVAELSNDSSIRLKAGAYVFAMVIGSMNYSHYAAPHWRPTFMAVGLALMSSASPWLWGVHTRRTARDQLMERKLLEERGVRLGASRWTWHPFRSVRVTSWASWHSINDPARVIAHFSGRYGTADTPDQSRADSPARAILQRAMEVPGTIATLPVPPPALTIVPAAPDVPARPAPVGAPVVIGTAALSAPARISGTQPPQALIDEVEAYLWGLPDDDLPSAREVARRLGDPNQRRLGTRLLKKRASISGGLAPVPPGEEPQARPARQPARLPASSLIAQPAGWSPGGAPHDS